MEEKQALIYLVEDDVFIVNLYKRLFKVTEFELATASNGEDAIEDLRKREKKPDLILLDIILPRLNGFELLKLIKDNDSLKQIPVVVLTNLSEEEQAKKALELGVSLYLVKSLYTPQELIDKVKEIIRSKQ